MWRSSSSPSSGACASATSARAAQPAVSRARGARIPPRPTPPSRSAQLPSEGRSVSRGETPAGLLSGPRAACPPPPGGGELGLEFLRLQGALCTLDRSMATRGQGQCASPWSPRTPLTGLTPMSSWGKTAGMASMRLSSAQTAASTGELPLGTRGWWGGGRPGGPAAV